jgi:GTPase
MSASSFIDEITIRVRAGEGGSGSSSFAREKYKPKGGPDGGDGGRGGSIVLEADAQIATLADFVKRREVRAAPGGTGRSNNRTGAEADDVVLRVPVGTLIWDADDGVQLADLAKPGARYVVAQGGRGGRGNTSLRSSADRSPNFAEQGEPGQERSLRLELRLSADVGLLGLPNAGKSTLLRAVSRATPKVADYPFTTLSPHLGVVDSDEGRFVVADLPGLIEGAAEGKGLGLRFLRHAERCAVLAAVVDLAEPDPAGTLATVAGEAEAYDPRLAQRIRVVVGNKNDLASADDTAARAWAEEHGARFLTVSALEGAGIEALVAELREEAERARAEEGEPETFALFRPVEEDPIEVLRDGEAFRVRSRRVERLVSMTPMGNPRAIRHLQRRLRALGVESALEREGAKEGDDVSIGNVTFEYLPEEHR